MHKLFIEINDTQFPIDTNSIVLDWFEKNKIANQFYVNYDNHKIIVKQNFFSPVLEVPNVCRYIIKKENDSYIFVPFETRNPIFIESNFNDNLINYREDIKDTIVLVLESPHYEEYNKLDFKPISPAQHKTGENIKTFLAEILNKNKEELHLTKSEYRFIIINPIPFQTSLNFLHKQPIRKKDSDDKSFVNLRNNVWNTLWLNNMSYKDSFISNIKKLAPEIILNCCTSELRDKVSLAIKESDNNAIKYWTAHPSHWDKIKDEIKIFKIK